MPQSRQNEVASIGDKDEEVWLVVSLRDYFAGQALAGIVGSGFVFSEKAEIKPPRNADNFALWSYQIADAMLAKRNQK